MCATSQEVIVYSFRFIARAASYAEHGLADFSQDLLRRLHDAEELISEKERKEKRKVEMTSRTREPMQFQLCFFVSPMRTNINGDSTIPPPCDTAPDRLRRRLQGLVFTPSRTRWERRDEQMAGKRMDRWQI